MVYVFLADGFEEIEALTPVDLLRRVKVETKLVAVASSENSSGDLVIRGARGIPVVCDMSLEELINGEGTDNMDIAVLPGGMPGTLNLRGSKTLMELIDKQNEKGGRIAAICAAPAKILGERGMLKGKKATCYPGMEDLMIGAILSADSVVTDGNITTSRGMGTAMAFGLEMVKLLLSEATAKDLAEGVVAKEEV